MVITRIIVLILFSNVAIAAPPMFEKVSAFCDVPARVLYAVAKVESNDHFWTINVKGQGRFFDTREELYSEVMSAISDGNDAGIGLMQLNWNYKRSYTDSVWQITDPVNNLVIACRIIKEHYDRHSNWLTATGYYHREAQRPIDFKIRKKYMDKVKFQLDKLEGFE